LITPNLEACLDGGGCIEQMFLANRSQLNGHAELFCFDIFRAFQSMRSQFKGPRGNERDGKSDNDCEHNKAHCPIRNLEKREDLGGNLNEQPTDDGVRDRDFGHVAAL
jgi:hypothetical protein